MRAATLFALAVASVGCAPDPLEGHFACGADDECPVDWTCRSDGRCYSTPGALDGGRDAGLDAGPGPVDAAMDAGGDDGGRDGGGVDGGCLPATSKVDLLFLIDNSNSMVEEQRQLADTFPALVATLVTGDINGDGIADFAPLESLHVGVVTADMGTAGFVTPTCMNDPMFGHDGVLQTNGDTSNPACSPTYPMFLDYRAPGGQADLTRDMACLVTNRRDGCGFEQQLEAVLKAVTPSTSPVRFLDNTVGHGDGANAGFLRDDSVLLTVVISDEDDCSAMDGDLFNSGSTRYPTGLNLRCTRHPEALWPVSRYVQGLSRLRPPQRTVFAGLVGMPTRLQGQPYDDVLADPEMAYRDDGFQMTPACMSGTGSAFPGRRYVELARGLEGEGAGAVIHSICQADYQPTWTAILQELAARSAAVCD